MNVASVAEQLFFTTALITASNDEAAWVGTGFFHVAETDKGHLDVLVTNKHVVETASAITLRLIETSGEGPDLGHGVPITIQDFTDRNWTGHPHPDVDVAVVPIRPALDALLRSGKRVFYKQIPSGMMLDDADLETLDALESIVFIGYPSGIYDTVNLTPIARQGITATPIAIDYQGLPAFLIDASVFPGSSGSPVFTFSRGIRTSKDGSTSIGGSSLQLLGVLAAVHTREVDGRITTSTPVGVTFDEPVDLGIVFRASAITDCVDSLLEQHALVRTEQPAAEVPVSPSPSPSEADDQLADDA